MSSHERDPGLQPERTMMSWLRTHLLLIWIGLLLVKLGHYHSVTGLYLVGVLMLITSLAGLPYNRKRFSRPFSDHMAVGYPEILVKRILSVVVLSVSVIYGLYAFKLPLLR